MIISTSEWVDIETSADKVAFACWDNPGYYQAQFHFKTREDAGRFLFHLRQNFENEGLRFPFVLKEGFRHWIVETEKMVSSTGQLEY